MLKNRDSKIVISSLIPSNSAITATYLLFIEAIILTYVNFADHPRCYIMVAIEYYVVPEPVSPASLDSMNLNQS